jgi:5-methylcytosine-specific restriction endonuclease McrA
MTPSEPPKFGTADVLDGVAGSYTTRAERGKRLESSRAKLIQLEESFTGLCVSNGSPDGIPAHTAIGTATKADLVATYTDKMAKGAGAARDVYDVLRASAPRGFCQYCSVAVVTALDHVVEKSTHPGLALSGRNLVPVCGRCNKIKEDTKGRGYLVLHPYYFPHDFQWLKAKVTNRNRLSVVFSTARSGLSAECYSRVKDHFERFELSYVYAAHATTELLGTMATLSDRARLNAAQLLEELTQQGQHWAQQLPNSWQSAFYSALAEHEDLPRLLLSNAESATTIPKAHEP